MQVVGPRMPMVRTSARAQKNRTAYRGDIQRKQKKVTASTAINGRARRKHHTYILNLREVLCLKQLLQQNNMSTFGRSLACNTAHV